MTQTLDLPTPTGAKPKPKRTKPTRSDQLRKLLARKSGATIAQIQTAFDWQPHTARAAISSQRKAGQTIERKESAKGSVYRLLAPADGQ